MSNRSAAPAYLVQSPLESTLAQSAATLQTPLHVQHSWWDGTNLLSRAYVHTHTHICTQLPMWLKPLNVCPWLTDIKMVNNTSNLLNNWKYYKLILVLKAPNHLQNNFEKLKLPNSLFCQQPILYMGTAVLKASLPYFKFSRWAGVHKRSKKTATARGHKMPLPTKPMH